MKKRVLTGVAAAIIAVGAVLLLDSLWMLVLLIALMVIAAFEIARMARLAAAVAMVLVVAVASLSVSWVLFEPSVAFVILAVCPLLFAIVALVTTSDPARSLASLGWLCFATPYLVLPVWALYEVHLQHPILLLTLVAAISCNDSAAFLVGSKLGRHKLSPALSPNKTWEGSLAGLFVGAGVGCLGLVWLTGTWSWWTLLLFVVVTVAGQMGDLVESLLKRAVSVKDSGTLLPGHGGVLDRLDAIILAAPVFYALLGLVDLNLP